MNSPTYRFFVDGHYITGVVAGDGDLQAMGKDIRRSANGKPFIMHSEPTPGHVFIYPEYSAESNGPPVQVPIHCLVSSPRTKKEQLEWLR